MKTPDRQDPEMRPDYDFTDAVRGKYAGRFGEGSAVVVLDLDVAAEFKTRKPVNDTLRAQLKNGPRTSGDDGYRGSQGPVLVTEGEFRGCQPVGADPLIRSTF